MGTKTTRRHFITSAVTGAAALTSPAQPSLAKTGRTLDLEDTKDNLDAYIKTRSDVAGADAPLWTTGQIFSFIPGQRSKLLFKTTGLAISRTVKDDTGYAWLNRECLYFQDPVTGEVLERWFNPYIEREVDVFHIRNSSANNRYDYEGEQGAFYAPYVEHTGDVIFYNDLMFFGPSPLDVEEYPAYVGSPHYQGAAVYNHHAKRADLEDPDLGAAPATLSWVSNRQWAPWMEMGSWAGGMIASTHGKKLVSVKDLPGDILDYMEANDPEYLSSPEQVDMSRTSFYEEFRKHVENKRQR